MEKVVEVQRKFMTNICTEEVIRRKESPKTLRVVESRGVHNDFLRDEII